MTFTVQQTGSSSTKGNPSFLRCFWNWAEENCRCSQNLWRRRKMLLKQKPSKHCKWIARFYYFRYLYSPLGCIAHNNCMSCPSIWATYLHCSLIYFWVFPVVFTWSASSLEGEIIPAQRCLPVGGRLWHPLGGGGGFTYWLTDCFDVQIRRRPAATSSRRASFSALASANSFVYFASSATSRWRICML